MSKEIIERIFTGYCKANNRVQRVLCEYEETPLGLSLESVDCGHNSCAHAMSCDLMERALSVEDEG
ncbi:MAG: hypothetical protein AB7D36_04085 [Oscillospiraceae bacterium]